MNNKKRLWNTAVLFIISVFFSSCSPYSPEFEDSLVRAGANSKELESVWKQLPENQKEGFEFLVVNMPERDLTSLKSDFLLDNMKWAYKARKQYTWAKNLPDSVFYNEVLPYATFNERRDNWREDFYGKFSSLVENCQTLEEAIDTVNHTIMNIVKVKYSTAREKADQSPYESIEQGLASCTGLSILLTDAFRSVGIPTRIAGTPNWTTKQGNHNWCEVLIDGEWLFTEYYASKQLNEGWLLADAGKADSTQEKHWIYASSWKKQAHHYPLVWDTTIAYVPAQNVTGRYMKVYQKKMKLQAERKGKYLLNVLMFNKQGCTMGDDRISTKVSVYNKKNELVKEDMTSGPLEDMNDLLSFYLEKGSSYQLMFKNAKGERVSKAINAEGKSQTIHLYMD